MIELSCPSQGTGLEAFGFGLILPRPPNPVESLFRISLYSPSKGTAWKNLSYPTGVKFKTKRSVSSAFPSDLIKLTILWSASSQLIHLKPSGLQSRLVMAGKLFEFTCPHCGYTASLVNPCLYLDPDNRACVYLVVSEDMAEGVIGMFDGFEEDDGTGGINGSKRRIVWDRHELRGKAIAIANGLDDRAVELVKFAVNGSAKMGGHAPMDAECITNLIGMEGEDLLFHIEIGDSEVSAVAPRGGYELFADAITRSSLRDDEPYFVDREWAGHATEVIDAEGVMD